MSDVKRILVYAIPEPGDYSSIQEKLTQIGGTTPDGRPRLFLEWGGTARRYFGIHKVAKYAATQIKETVGYTVVFDPKKDKALVKKFGPKLEFQTQNIDDIPVEFQYRKKGSIVTPRIILPEMAYVDYPIPNYWITDWMSPQKMMAGGWHSLFGPEPREGYYAPIFRIHNPNNFEYAEFREPDMGDVEMAEKYQREKVQETIDMGRHFDEPLDGNDAQILNGWIAKAIQHAREESKQIRIQEYAEELEKIMKEEREGHRPMVTVV